MKDGELSQGYKPEEELWTDKKRTALFGLPLSFTRYSLTETRLIIRKGFLSLREDEIKLYRIRDLALTQSLIERTSNTGTIRVCSADALVPNIEIKHIKNPRAVKDMISKGIDVCRKNSGMQTSELIGGQGRPPMPISHD